MAREVTYIYCGSKERCSSDVAAMVRLVQQLTAPKASLITNPAGSKGYLDFLVLDDGSIQMELNERHDDFATVDVAMAAYIIEMAMTDTRDMTLREKLGELAIDWLP